MKIIERFLSNVSNNPNKCAFIYYKKNKIAFKTYLEVFNDMLRTIDYLKKKAVQGRLLLFLKPCYEFYVLLLAGVYKGYQLIVIEDFSDKEKVTKMIETAQVDYCIVNSLTAIVKYLYKPLRNIKSLNIDRMSIYKVIPTIASSCDDSVLYTFTSGTTGIPKMIVRTKKDLDRQFNAILQTFSDFSKKDLVLSLLPVYTLAFLVLGATVLIYPKRLEKGKNQKQLELLLNKTRATALCGSVSSYLQFKRPMELIKRTYLGGSLISLQDAYKIKTMFPNASHSYVYGSSEAVLISKTTLDEYIVSLKNGQICVGEIVPGIELEVINKDNSSIGEFQVKGDVVLNNNQFETGDLGYIRDNRVYLKGRKKFCFKDRIYNYEIEMKILNNIIQVKKAVFIIYNEKQFLIVETKGNWITEIRKYVDDKTEIIQVSKMPLDMRHKYKVDYEKVIKEIEKKARVRHG